MNKCKICGKELKTKKAHYCHSCAMKKVLSEKPEILEQRKKTCIEKYGVDNPFKTDLAKKSLLKKYGVDNPSLIPEIVEKRKQTFIKNFGVDNPQKNKEIHEKTQQTCLKRYGHKNPYQSKKNTQKRMQSYKQGAENKRIFYQNAPKEYFENVQRKIKITQNKSIAKDGKKLNSSWEVKIWNYCLDHNLNIKDGPVLEYFVNNKKRRVLVDFEIEGRLFEIKGGHLIDNVYKDIKVYNKHKCLDDNNVIVITSLNYLDKFKKTILIDDFDDPNFDLIQYI
jgi:hypothetical protein